MLAAMRCLLFLLLLLPVAAAATEPRPLVLEPNRYSYTYGVPNGWSHDYDAARQTGVRSILVPKGGSFHGSPSIIYVNEVDCGAADVVDCVVDRFRPGNPNLLVTPASPISTTASSTARVILLDGASDPRQAREAIAFLEEEETTVLVVLSTKDTASWAKDMRAFEIVVSGFEYFDCSSPSLAVPCSGR